DILDVTQTSEQLGKSAGKDANAGKTTYPSVLGLEGSKKEAARLTEKALGSLTSIGERGVILRALAEKLLARQS
ncbi:MAG: polyprenyl synthetase family protein, partial [Terrimicrobiaceae bacterium]